MLESAEVINLDNARQTAILDSLLAKSDKNEIHNNVSNIILIIGHDPVLLKMCGYDEFQCLHVIHHPAPSPFDNDPDLPGPYPRAWSAADVSHTQAYIQRTWIKAAKKTDVEDAMVAVATSRRYHPVKDWLDSLKWDGEPRLNQWLQKTFGTRDGDYENDVASCFLIAAVRRVRSPGIKFDHMAVFEGVQGIGKSTAIKILFGEKWFTDSLPAALENKDAALGLQGVWCIEFAEIEQIIRNEVEVIKAFLSRSVDRFRAPYARTYLTHPRQCVMVGTTNDKDYLRDATGNRRFWPIWCEFVDLEWIAGNREQIWAEAATREAAGEDHWICDVNSTEQAKEAQQDRQQEDVWEDKVKAYLLGKPTARTADILSEALFIPVKDHNRREQMRVAGILKRLGWSIHVMKEGDRSYREWRDPK
jgi:predicted P-loop ATPase